MALNDLPKARMYSAASAKQQQQRRFAPQRIIKRKKKGKGTPLRQAEEEEAREEEGKEGEREGEEGWKERERGGTGGKRTPQSKEDRGNKRKRTLQAEEGGNTRKRTLQAEEDEEEGRGPSRGNQSRRQNEHRQETLTQMPALTDPIRRESELRSVANGRERGLRSVANRAPKSEATPTTSTSQRASTSRKTQARENRNETSRKSQAKESKRQETLTQMPDLFPGLRSRRAAMDGEETADRKQRPSVKKEAKRKQRNTLTQMQFVQLGFVGDSDEDGLDEDGLEYEDMDESPAGNLSTGNLAGQARQGAEPVRNASIESPARPIHKVELVQDASIEDVAKKASSPRKRRNPNTGVVEPVRTPRKRRAEEVPSSQSPLNSPLSARRSMNSPTALRSPLQPRSTNVQLRSESNIKGRPPPRYLYATKHNPPIGKAVKTRITEALDIPEQPPSLTSPTRNPSSTLR